MMPQENSRFILGGENNEDAQIPRDLGKEILQTRIASQRLDNERVEKEKGFLGKLFGNSTSAPQNIAGLMIFLLLIFGGAYTGVMLGIAWKCSHSQVLDFWNIIIPIITLALGYLFGKNN